MFGTENHKKLHFLVILMNNAFAKIFTVLPPPRNEILGIWDSTIGSFLGAEGKLMLKMLLGDIKFEV